MPQSQVGVGTLEFDRPALHGAEDEESPKGTVEPFEENIVESAQDQYGEQKCQGILVVEIRMEV